MLDIVDFHAHILPGADHGSGSVETSMWQIQSAASHGVTRIIATPHFYPQKHSVESFLERRDAAYNLLIKNVDKSTSIKLGAEVLICPGIENMPGLEKLFIRGTNTLLLELPFAGYDDAFSTTVKELRSRGVDVIMAHADRYDSRVVDHMLRAGARIQLNASSLVGFFRRKSVLQWLDLSYVVALGSDIHQMDKEAYKNFASAISRISDKAELIKKESDIIFSKAK